MKKADRFNFVIEYFSKTFPEPKTELHYKNPFQLLVAVILSAQCTDKRVNIVTPKLFRNFPNAKAMAASSAEQIFEFIKSVSFPNNKSKHLYLMSNMLLNDFNGKVPSEVDDLVKLPGVGRKTANVIASVIFNKAAMAVDTHVFRVSNRLGLTINSKSPDQTERELIKHIPEHIISKAHHWLILHGRYVCKARSPECGVCGIRECCKYYSLKKIKR
jgi:endonuclease-3